jgi:hypothetical protein
MKTQYKRMSAIIVERIPDSVVIYNLKLVNNTPLTVPFMQLKVIKKIHKDNRIEVKFLENPDQFYDIIINLYTRPINELSRIPELTPFLVENLFAQDKNKKFLKTPIIVRDEQVFKV